MRKTSLRRVSKEQSKELALRGKLKKELITEQEYPHCMTCGGNGDFRGLSMHHIKLLAQGGKTEKANLIILCGNCHSEAHGIREI